MKKTLILTLALVALFAVGTVYAMSLDQAPVVTSIEASTGIAGLPTTVLDQLSTEITLCFRGDMQCPDVWDPVTCSNGVTYSNGCYAYLACATGCSGGGSSI